MLGKFTFLHSLLGVLCELKINFLYGYHVCSSVHDLVSVNNPSFSEFMKSGVGEKIVEQARIS